MPNNMVADKGKKAKHSDKPEDDNSEVIDEKLVISIEKLQEIQDELEKVLVDSMLICAFTVSFFLVSFFWFLRTLCLAFTWRTMMRSDNR